MSKVYEIFENNPMAFGMYYFPHHIRDKTPSFHHKILQESMKHRYFAVAAPRGSAKSTVLTFLKTVHKIAFKKTRFVVICQNTLAKAEGSLETIKAEFRENKLFKKDFNIKIEKDKIGDSVFIIKNKGEEPHKIRVLCKGAEQIGGVRGEKFGAYRPDYILIDDLEDDTMVKSPEGRESIRELYDKALIKAGDVHTLEVDAIGTILHDDCLIARLISKDYYLSYRKLKYKARNIDKDGKKYSLWPQRWTVEELDEMEDEDPTTFAQEMQNDPVSGKLSKFNKEDFRRWYVENNDYVLLDQDNRIISRGELRHCKAAIACDLAWEEKKESDDTVLLAGFITPQSDLLLDKYINDKGMRPDEFGEHLFAMEEKYRTLTGKTVQIGFEKAKLEKVMKWLLKKEMRARGVFLYFKDLLWDKDKITRIVTRLQPRYKQNVIFHRAGMGELEYQLLRVPYGTHDDLADAAQGLVQLLQNAPSKPKHSTPVEDEGFEFLQNLAVESKTKKATPSFFNMKSTPTFGDGKINDLVVRKSRR